MKAIALNGVKEFKLVDIDEPVSEPGRVLIAVKRSGICGSDIHYWDLGEPKGMVMGHEFAGTVLDPGNRRDLKFGDKVTALPCTPCGKCESCLTGNTQRCPHVWDEGIGLSLKYPGGLTSKISVREDMVMKLPDNVSFEQGALVEPMAVGLHAAHLANIKVGDRVLVIGAGIIGLMSGYFAKREGASYVAISETNKARGQNTTKLGVADGWFDPRTPDLIPKLVDATRGGFDVVLDCVGNSHSVADALTLIKSGGTIVNVGVSMKPIEFPVLSLMMKEVKFRGCMAYNKDEFATCIELIARNQFEPLKFISAIVGLGSVQISYQRLTSGTDPAVKIMVDPSII